MCPRVQSSSCSTVSDESRRYACTTTPADGPCANSSSASSSSTQAQHSLARVERLHVHVQVRAEVARKLHQAAGARPRRAFRPPAPRAQQRGEADTFTLRFARGILTNRIALQCRPLRPLRGFFLECCERRPAPFRVAVGFLHRDRRLPEQVDGGGDASLPEVGQQRKRILGRLPDDEPVGHVTDCGSGGKAERAGAGLRVRHPDRHVERRGPVVHLVQERSGGGRGPRRAARRYHVDEAEQRRAQLWRRAKASSIALSSSAFTGWRAGDRRTPPARADVHDFVFEHGCG